MGFADVPGFGARFRGGWARAPPRGPQHEPSLRRAVRQPDLRRVAHQLGEGSEDVAQGEHLVDDALLGHLLVPAKRGITRDYTPFLLTLQGITFQLQGIALPPF